MKNRKNISIKQWLPIEKVYEDGNIKLKNKSIIKILKIFPIHFNLKSNLEKEAILNSYKKFLKTCDFDIQILIQSKKEDLSKHISEIQRVNEKKDGKIKNIAQKYIKYILETNRKKRSSSKNFFIILKESPEKRTKNKEEEKIYIEKLNEKYLIIKETLARCGNTVHEIDNKEEVKKILYSFLNTRKELDI